MSRAEDEAVARRMAQRREVLKAAQEQFERLDEANREQIRIQFERAANEARSVIQIVR